MSKQGNSSGGQSDKGLVGNIGKGLPESKGIISTWQDIQVLLILCCFKTLNVFLFFLKMINFF